MQSAGKLAKREQAKATSRQSVGQIVPPCATTWTTDFFPTLACASSLATKVARLRQLACRNVACFVCPHHRITPSPHHGVHLVKLRRHRPISMVIEHAFDLRGSAPARR